MPYTYTARHKSTGRWYYGARWAIGSDPAELGVSYFTSSGVVNSIVASEGAQAFEWKVRRRFAEIPEAVKHEHRVLTRVDAVMNPKFLNQHNGCHNFSSFWQTISREERQEILGPNARIASLALRAKWASMSKEERSKANRLSSLAMKKATRKLWVTIPKDERRKKHPALIAVDRKRSHLSVEEMRAWTNPGVEAMKAEKAALTKEELKSRVANAAAVNRLRVVCEFCGVSCNRGMYGRWHGAKCRKRNPK